MALWLDYEDLLSRSTSREPSESGNVDFDPTYNPPPLPPRRTAEQRAREAAAASRAAQRKNRRPPPRTKHVRI